jgi:hypothetical protein
VSSTPKFETVTGPLYRVATVTDVWSWPDVKEFSKSGIPPRDRWDDPNQLLGTLYTSDTAEGAFIEKLQYLRPDTSYLAQLKKIDSVEALTSEDEAITPSLAFIGGLVIGEVDDVDVQALRVDHQSTMGYLHEAAAVLLSEHGVSRLDKSVLLSENRPFTQGVARHARVELQADAISCQSRWCNALNVSVFEPVDRTHAQNWFLERAATSNPIDADNEDLLRACEVLGLRPPA